MEGYRNFRLVSGTMSLFRKHSQSGEKGQGLQVSRTWYCQEHWLVELDNADKQDVAACEGDKMRAFKLGVNARMALNWGSS